MTTRCWPIRRLAALGAAAAVALLPLAGACTGPSLYVENPDGHQVYVDGVAIGRVARPADGTIAAANEGMDDAGRTDTGANTGAGPATPTRPAAPPTRYEIPFRYFGTAHWDAEPAANADGTPDFDRLPATGAVAIPAAASPLLFPFDFPLDVFDRLLHGRRDRTVRIVVPDAPAALRGNIEIPPAALGELSARARAARIER